MHCDMHLWTHWRFPYFCTHCLMQCFVHRSTNWCFPYFCTYCLMHCYMYRWTHSCFPCFVHTISSSVTCTVGHIGVFTVLYKLLEAVLHAPLDTIVFSVFLYILFDPVLHAPLDTLVFSVFCIYCLMHCYMHLWTHWRFPYFCT